MSLADDLRARMRLIPVHWEQHKLYARALAVIEAVEHMRSAGGAVEFQKHFDIAKELIK